MLLRLNFKLLTNFADLFSDLESVPLVLMSVQWSHRDLALGWGRKGMAIYASSPRRQGLLDVFLHLILRATLRSRSDRPHYIDEAQRD